MSVSPTLYEQRLGYGLTTLTPFTRFTLDNDDRRSASAGLRWTLDDNIAIKFEVTRNDSGAERDGEVRLEGAVRF